MRTKKLKNNIYMLGLYVRYPSVMPYYPLRGNSAVTDRDITDTMTYITPPLQHLTLTLALYCPKGAPLPYDPLHRSGAVLLSHKSDI